MGEWTSGTVNVATPDGPVSLDAEISGVWAVHQTLWQDCRRHSADYWSLTHVPTGLGLLHWLHAAEVAKRAAARIDPLWDWSSVTEENRDAVPERVQRRVQRIGAEAGITTVGVTA